MKSCAAILAAATLACCVAALPLRAKTRAVPSAPPAAASAPSGLAETLRTLFGVGTFKQAAISPDGKRVAWVENLGDKDGKPSVRSRILVAETGGAAASRRITAVAGTAERNEGSVAWSPDSRRLAFVSDAVKEGQTQLYVADLAGGRVRKLTDVKGLVASPGWSPDGRTLAILFTRNSARAAGPLVAGTPQTGVIEETVTEQRLAIVDAATGTLRELSPAEVYIYEYDWSPDGRRFIATAAHGSGDDNWYVAELATIDAVTGETRSIVKPALQIAAPAWSPDGRRIAYISGLMSDEGSVGNDIYTCDDQGGNVEDLTPGMKGSAAWVDWMPDGKTLLFAEYRNGEAGLAALDTASRASTPIWSGAEQVSAGNWGMTLSVSADGRSSAVIRHAFDRAPEVWAGPHGAWRPITARNAALRPMWGEAKSLRWSSQGREIQGWLLYPRDFDPSKRYPLVVSVHGGPASMAQSHWPGRHDFAAALASRGYFVLYPNPRGSFGQGEAFVRANVKDFGHGDLQDILAGVDAALAAAPIDPARLGITGWSYGGYMSMWAVTQTDRFHAAMAGAGVANFQSYYGQNRIDQWMLPYFGASVYDDPAVYAKSSPITFIKNARTPTLVLVGEGDGECPPPQSFEFWHALKTLGVETKLVVYAHEGHGFLDPAHQRDVIERTAAWFDVHLKPSR